MIRLGFMAPPAGLEPATYGLEIRCSIQLSYGGFECWIMPYERVAAQVFCMGSGENGGVLSLFARKWGEKMAKWI